MSDLFHRLETHARQREARGASMDEMQLYRDVIHALTPYPKLSQASRETLTLIEQHPGINASRIADERNVTQRAAHDTVAVLERRKLITTRMEGNRRACYPVNP